MNDKERKAHKVIIQTRHILKMRSLGITIPTKENAKKYRESYRKRNPWIRHYTGAKTRCCYSYGKYYGRVTFDITKEEVKELWIRDKAHLLKEPSIDRINSKLGYCKANCRFIELKENLRLGNVKLSQEEVIKIKDMYFNKNISQTKIAKEFNVHQSAISLIVNGKRPRR